MQDIDFGKIYSSKRLNNKQDILGHHQNNTRMKNLRKLSFVTFVFLFAFAMGLLSGIYLNDKKLGSKEYLDQELITNHLGKNLKSWDGAKFTEDKDIQTGEEKMISRNVGPRVENPSDNTARGVDQELPGAGKGQDADQRKKVLF